MTKIKLNAGNLMIILMYSLILFLVVIIAYIFYNRGNIGFLPEIPPVITSGPFSNCKQLAENCNKGECDYYNLCAVTPDFKNCRVFDCGKNYTIEITAKDGKISVSTYSKPSVKEAKESIDACHGTVKIISNKCENNIRKVNAEVVTKNVCPPQAFIFKRDDQWQPATFSGEGQNQYMVAIPACDSVQELKAISAKGIIIGSAVPKK